MFFFLYISYCSVYLQKLKEENPEKLKEYRKGAYQKIK